jgi:hypothetical protein
MLKTKTLPRVGLGAGILFLVIGAVLASGCTSQSLPPEGDVPGVPASSGGNGPTNGKVQTDSAGAVTVAVEWLGEENGSLALGVTMNTHSVDLDSYDLSKLATLSDDRGNLYLPAAWDSLQGGHHRQGRLTFPVPDAYPGYLHLIIRDLGGVEARTFHWELAAS